MGNAQIPAMTNRAFEAMLAGRPGPAALILPQDLMGFPAEIAGSASPVELRRNLPDFDVIGRAAERIVQSSRPVILAGGGAVYSDAGKQIEELADRLGCPIITTLNGKGIVDERSLASLGHGRTRRARMALTRADLMLAVGCRFTEFFTASGTMRIPQSLIQIDIDPSQIALNYPVEQYIIGDARTVLSELISRLSHRESAWKDVWRRARQAEQLKPEWLIDTLRSELPESSIFFTDACEMGLRMHTDFPAYATRTFFYPSNYAALGWGYPAAVGGAVGQSERWTVCVSGDGGFTMTAQELATALRYKLKLIAVVHNDSTYGAIKAIQRMKHGARYVDTDLNNPDFVKFGESFGVASCRTPDAGQFATALRLALTRNGPSLIEVPEERRSLFNTGKDMSLKVGRGGD
jgi:acetolactate synthase-1/2/3 large subunit